MRIKDEPEEAPQRWVVERIEGRRSGRGGVEYLVIWEGFSAAQSTWEPVEHLESARDAVDAFEAMLFPPFQQVLQADIAEFTPYVFQVLAQLLECRTGLSAAYLYKGVDSLVEEVRRVVEELVDELQKPFRVFFRVALQRLSMGIQRQKLLEERLDGSA